MNVGRASAWADAVFHVLAHVDAPGAASCFSPAYATWIAAKLGPGAAWTLEEDVRVLTELARADADLFARAQAIAWVFRSADAVRAATDHELREAKVDDEDARATALAAGPLAEVLRAAAELQMPQLEGVAVKCRLPEVEDALHRVAPAAPALREVSLTPALGLRGRVHDAHIFVGVPEIAGATAEHIAWQAAHEATVHEVASAAPLPFLELERRALGLLRSRARRVGLGDEHARWFAHLDVSGLGAIPDVEDPA